MPLRVRRMRAISWIRSVPTLQYATSVSLTI